MTQLGLNYSVPKQDRSRLRGQCLAIYQRLQQGPATNAELAAISLKYTSRVDDLRKNGVGIDAERVSGGTWRYSLVTP
jgi:hypothetical protein